MNPPSDQSPDPHAPEPSIRRSTGTWLTLLIVWSLGVLSWMAYIGLAVVILYRVF